LIELIGSSIGGSGKELRAGDAETLRRLVNPGKDPT